MHPQLLAARLPDAAPRLALPNVTMVAVTGVALPQTVRALEVSLARIQPAATVLLTDRAPPPGGSAEIVWRAIPQLDSRRAYSRFMLNELVRHVPTSHVLSVQWDGYVLDQESWRPEFLEFDYIGAPWPHWAGPHMVGNGGFSLRSRKLLESVAALGIDEAPEDIAICRTHRGVLETRFGIRFAPPELARRFAYEREKRRGDEFGFHGVYNLRQLTDRPTFRRLIEELEPGQLTEGEYREIRRSALRRADLRLAWIARQRLRARRLAVRGG